MNDKPQENITFDPTKLFPARIATADWKARSISEVERMITGAGGMTDLVKHEAILPTNNNAYCRTIRLHEALHAIYTTPPSAERIAAKRPLTVLEQGLEDARLHANCARTEGAVRRDEVATALHDLHGAAVTHKTLSDRDTVALLALRSAAILQAQPTLSEKSGKRAMRLLAKLCSRVGERKVGDKTVHYSEALPTAIDHIRADRMDEASAVLKPFFTEWEERPMMKAFPMLIIFGKAERDRSDKMEADVNFAKVDGKVGTIAASMLSDKTLRAIQRGTMPKLHIHHIFAQHNVKTYFGADEKHTMSGLKISAKKLACTVGPIPPRLFIKRIRRNGGSVLIDASSSMGLSPATLLKLVNEAPLATIAFYNAPHDSSLEGNLWVFAHKGKRALDFTMIYGDRGGMMDGYDPHNASFNYFGGGNVVDFQALQWLLTMPKPRYFLCDLGWTGPEATQMAADELFNTALARKQLVHVGSFKEMKALLRNGVVLD